MPRVLPAPPRSVPVPGTCPHCGAGNLVKLVGGETLCRSCGKRS